MKDRVRYGRVYLKEKRDQKRDSKTDSQMDPKMNPKMNPKMDQEIVPASMEHPLEGSMESPALDYVTFGSGSRSLVILPGINVHSVWSAAMSYATSFRELVRSFQVYCFDQRAPLGEGMTLEMLGEDIHTAIEVLSLQKADVLGISMGGMLAQYLACNHPEDVHKLVLAVTTCQLGERIRETALRWSALAEKSGIREAYRDMFSCCFTQSFQNRFERMRDAILDMNPPIQAERFSRLSRLILSLDICQRLKDIRCETLVIGACRDQVMGEGASYELAKELGCELSLYQEGAHSIFIEQGDDFSRRAAEFFNRQVR